MARAFPGYFNFYSTLFLEPLFWCFSIQQKLHAFSRIHLEYFTWKLLNSEISICLKFVFRYSNKNTKIYNRTSMNSFASIFPTNAKFHFNFMQYSERSLWHNIWLCCEIPIGEFNRNIYGGSCKSEKCKLHN